jgi:hypothetical protein
VSASSASGSDPGGTRRIYRPTDGAGSARRARRVGRVRARGAGRDPDELARARRRDGRPALRLRRDRRGHRSGAVRARHRVDGGARAAARALGRRAHGPRREDVLPRRGLRGRREDRLDDLAGRGARARRRGGRVDRRPRRRLPRARRQGRSYGGVEAGELPRAHPEAADRRGVSRARGGVLVERDLRREVALARRPRDREVRARQRT